MISPLLLAPLMTHGVFGGEGRQPTATKFISKVPMKPKPVFSKSELEEGRALPRPLRKKYFAKLKEQYYESL